MGCNSYLIVSALIKRVRIPKEDGSERLLGIPTVLGRVIQQAIVQALSPIFVDPTFSEHTSRPSHSITAKRLHLPIAFEI